MPYRTRNGAQRDGALVSEDCPTSSAGPSMTNVRIEHQARHPRQEAEYLWDGISKLVAAITSPPAVGIDRAELLAAVAHSRAEIARRPTVSTRSAVAIFHRDSWTCRYCGIKTIAPPFLRFLGEIYPKEFSYHPNWKAGETHEAWLLISTSLDHLVPGARGGDWLAPENLVTACWACNSAKADLLLDELGWELLSEDEVRSEWDGLTNAVEALWVQAGSPEGIFRNWRQALAQRP